MENSLSSRFKKAWNVFTNRDPTTELKQDIGVSYYSRPDRFRFTRGNERSIVTSVFNRISLDVAAVDIKHCKIDKNNRYVSDVDSYLNDCLTLEANLDQTSRAFLQDVVMSMLDEGCVAIVPVDISTDPQKTNSYDILSLRTGKVVEWKPRHIKVKVYNDRTGRKEDVLMSKNDVAIIENPLYSVINEPNSTLQRLIRKLSLLDVTDEQTASNKLNIIVQLPYTVRSDIKRNQAAERIQNIEMQLIESKYGIAYADSTEKITQLNRPLENNLMSQVEYLTKLLFSQLGISQEILDGTADEKAMLNYYNRTVEPIIFAITEELKRKFLTKTARTQGQSIIAFRDPFKLVPVNNIAEIADKFTRNEILTSNEIRQIIGMKPSDDPKADKLINSNLNQAEPSNEPFSEQPINEENENVDIMDVPINEIS